MLSAKRRLLSNLKQEPWRFLCTRGYFRVWLPRFLKRVYLFIRFFRGAPSLLLLDKNLPFQYQALMLIVTFPSDASALLVLVQVYS